MSPAADREVPRGWRERRSSDRHRRPEGGETEYYGSRDFVGPRPRASHGTLSDEHQPPTRGPGTDLWILAPRGPSFLENSPTAEIERSDIRWIPKQRQDRKRPRSDCAFCKTPFTRDNDSREHLIPNAIGGRRTVTRFVCKSCNAKSGSNWDSALADQFKPICTLLNIDRHRGNVPSLRVQTIGGDTLQLHADGRATSPHPKVTETRIDNQVSIQITAPSMTEFTRTLRRLADKYPQIDVDKALRDARTTRKFIRDPWMIKVEGRPEAERSTVKSLVAMAAYHGIDIENLEHAREYLLSDGSPCFGWLNDVDIVVNRPPERFFHCVFIRVIQKTSRSWVTWSTSGINASLHAFRATTTAIQSTADTP